MASQFTKLAAKIVAFGGRIISKAFGQAYREAAQSAKSGQSTKETVKSFRKGMKKQMIVKEAEEILNIDHESSIADIIKNHDHLYKMNDDEKGGSFYIQSKVHNALETLKIERSKEFETYFKELKMKEQQKSE